MTRFALVCGVVLGLAFSACADPEVEIDAQMTSTPDSPVPGVAAIVEVSVTGDGSPLSGANVMAEPVLEGSQSVQDPVQLTSEGGGLYTGALVYPEEGAWRVIVSVDASEGAEAFGFDVTVSCGEARELGLGCCESANCAAGLWCEANACSDGPRPLGEGCNSNEQCADDLWCEVDACSDGPRPLGEACVSSDQCASGLWCEASACSDAPRPVGESCEADDWCQEMLWCEASLCSDSPKPNGLACLDPSMCQSGYCSGGLCVDPPWSIIGKGDGTPASVDWTLVLAIDLSGSCDLAFNPGEDMELWVTNRDTDSLTVIHDPGAPTQSHENYYDFSKHFLEEVVAISFGDSGTFATCGDTRNTYDDLFFEQMDFMGPTLWPAIEQDFVTYGPDAAGVHLDMLHSSPQCMGIAASGENTFYTFSGYHGYLGWYDFKEPHADVSHGHGGEDHSDGIKWVFPEVKLTRVDGVPGHMVHEPIEGVVYVSDTGTGRLLKINPKTATWAGVEQSWWGDGIQEIMTGATVTEVVGTNQGLIQPAGLALHDGVLFVGDHATGWLFAYTVDGTLVNSLDTGLGQKALGGITVGPDGQIYLVDMLTNRVLRINSAP